MLLFSHNFLHHVHSFLLANNSLQLQDISIVLGGTLVCHRSCCRSCRSRSANLLLPSVGGLGAIFRNHLQTGRIELLNLSLAC